MECAETFFSEALGVVFPCLYSFVLQSEKGRKSGIGLYGMRTFSGCCAEAVSLARERHFGDLKVPKQVTNL